MVGNQRAQYKRKENSVNMQSLYGKLTTKRWTQKITDRIIECYEQFFFLVVLFSMGYHSLVSKRERYLQI